MFKKSATYYGIFLGIAILAATTAGIWGCAQARPAKAQDNAASVKTESAADTASPATVAAGLDELNNGDCRKCHASEPAAIAGNGGKHKTQVTCMDCHVEHLPSGTQTIPVCSMCHDPDERAHFQLENCLGCHRNPHTPLDLNIADTPKSTAGCLTCHEDKGKEFSQFPSKHAEQNCTLCHPKKHKVIYKCLECHEPHADFMVFEDCLRCHRPHSPLEITYAADTPSKFCGSCHGDLYEMLEKNKSKHHKLNCAFCHKDRHPTVPSCNDCHQAPHSGTMMANFPDCLRCHNNPHDIII